MMPRMDGLQTLELRKIPRASQTPVIFLTAHSPSRELVKRAYSLGAFDFIEKPVSADVLRGKVSAFVLLHQRGNEVRKRGEELRAKDRQIGVLAHEFRAPISAIALQAELLNLSIRIPGCRRHRPRLARAANRMSRMAEELLAFMQGLQAPPGAHGGRSRRALRKKSSMRGGGGGGGGGLSQQRASREVRARGRRAHPRSLGSRPAAPSSRKAWSATR